MLGTRGINIYSMLKSLEEKVKTIGNADLLDRYETLFQEYRYMLSFMVSGGQDANREQFLDSLRKRIKDLSDDLERGKIFQTTPGKDVILSQIKDIDTSAASLIASLQDDSLTPEQHFNALNNAFCAILFSLAWNTREERMWTAFLISSATNAIDAQTIVSAIMLSCRIKYCEHKYRTLAYAYLTADNEAVRQRALVGWVVNLAKADDEMLIEELLSPNENTREVLKLIMQMVASSNANKDSDRIRQEIMPDLLKHQMKSGILSDDIIKSDEDTLSDILNPGREEQEMEKVEKSIMKMNDMLKDGSDVFFGEFSKLKRYPFFYKPVNWFMPFVYEHPLLADARKKLESVKSLEHIYRNGPFCDSDKYSFTFGLSSVISALPDKVREMLSSGEVGPLGTLPQGSEREITPDYLRRMYVQDLYRFYNLSPQLKLESIFSNDVFFAPFQVSAMRSQLIDFGKFLMRRGYTHLMERVEYICRNMEKDEDKGEYDLLMATYYKSKGDYHRALMHYEAASSILTDNENALRGKARMALLTKNYSSAEAFYDELCEKHPENLALAQNRVLAKIHNGKASEMVNEAYRLDLEQENDLRTKRLLAWVLFCNMRLDEVVDIYAKILDGNYGEPSTEDYISHAELLWFTHRQQEAIHAVGKLLNDDDAASEKVRNCIASMENDFELLSHYYPVSPQDASLIVDAAMLL